MKTLILYYSYGGNTRRIAEQIREALNADLEEIQTASPYKGSYDYVVNQGKEEVNSGFMPELKPLNVVLNQYDTIILGSPVWWYTFAPAMKSFLYNNDLSGKIVYPYATNEGWLGHTFKDFSKACKGAKVQPGLNVRFNESQLLTPEHNIEKWILGIKEKEGH